MKLQGQLSPCWALNKFSLMGTSHMEETARTGRHVSLQSKGSWSI